jgi:competence ComEA-like helix-hairpin-helix protein
MSHKPLVDVGKFEDEIARFEQLCDSEKVTQKIISSKNHSPNFPQNYASKKNEHANKIEINTADSTELDKLRGIGPVLAHRIIKYRSILGGYYALSQLNEVYGLKPETVNAIEKQLTLDTSKIQKINLNTAGFKEINAHPYISYEQTKSIFKLRSKQKIEEISQMIDAGIFSAEEIKKVLPYVLFD